VSVRFGAHSSAVWRDDLSVSERRAPAGRPLGAWRRWLIMLGCGVVGFVAGSVSAYLVGWWVMGPAHHDGTDISIAVGAFGLGVLGGLVGMVIAVGTSIRLLRRR
jgi:hypothetical protein